MAASIRNGVAKKKSGMKSQGKSSHTAMDTS